MYSAPATPMDRQFLRFKRFSLQCCAPQRVPHCRGLAQQAKSGFEGLDVCEMSARVLSRSVLFSFLIILRNF